MSRLDRDTDLSPSLHGQIRLRDRKVPGTSELPDKTLSEIQSIMRLHCIVYKGCNQDLMLL